MKKKRFIAGASCPKCKMIDRLVTYQSDSGKHHRECVHCGFHDDLHFPSQAKELSTRVNESTEQIAAETQVLILDPRGANKH